MSDQTAVIIAQHITVILNNFNNWKKWLKIIKSKTWKHNIWEFVNSAMLKTDVLNLEVSEILKTIDVNSAVTSIAKLKNIEKNTYQVLLAQYNHKIFTYDQKMLVLQNLCTFIQKMISQIYLCYIFNTENIYKMLTALKNRVILTNLTRKTELSNYY